LIDKRYSLKVKDINLTSHTAMHDELSYKEKLCQFEDNTTIKFVGQL